MAIGQLARQMAKVKRRKVEDNRRKIRLIEGNAKCYHLKKFTCEGVNLSEALNPIPPLHIVYVYTEMALTDIILAKIYRFCQLLSHSRRFFARV